MSDAVYGGGEFEPSGFSFPFISVWFSTELDTEFVRAAEFVTITAAIGLLEGVGLSELLATGLGELVRLSAWAMRRRLVDTHTQARGGHTENKKLDSKT